MADQVCRYAGSPRQICLITFYPEDEIRHKIPRDAFRSLQIPFRTDFSSSLPSSSAIPVWKNSLHTNSRINALTNPRRWTPPVISSVLPPRLKVWWHRGWSHSWCVNCDLRRSVLFVMYSPSNTQKGRKESEWRVLSCSHRPRTELRWTAFLSFMQL